MRCHLSLAHGRQFLGGIYCHQVPCQSWSWNQRSSEMLGQYTSVIFHSTAFLRALICILNIDFWHPVVLPELTNRWESKPTTNLRNLETHTFIGKTKTVYLFGAPWIRSALSTKQAIASQLTPYSTILQKMTVVQLLRKLPKCLTP
jgi:hypothetical protein